jgi:hypothetical protein
MYYGVLATLTAWLIILVINIVLSRPNEHMNYPKVYFHLVVFIIIGIVFGSFYELWAEVPYE